jgi:hypothetical protein
MEKTAKKITLATVKSFIKKNRKSLMINVKSSFDGMVDGLAYYNNGFREATEEKVNNVNTFGIDGAWFVGFSRDYFRPYNDGTFEGIEVYNSCGKFILATKKA